MIKNSKDTEFNKLVRKQKIAMFFVGAVAKRKRNFREKILFALFKRMMPLPAPENDFMRDAICDSEPEFSVEELRAFRNGTGES